VRDLLDQFACQRAPGGLRLWTADTFQVSARVQEILRTLYRPSGPDVETLKLSERRSVLRISPFSRELPSLIVKGFPLRKFESRWKYAKYGLTEFCHYRSAVERRIPVPRCYGYFEVRAFGLVNANGVLIEDLRGWRSLAELANDDPQRSLAVLVRAVPLLKQLYEAGVNHIDASPQNILESPDRTEQRLIDWQYASFIAPRQIAQLVLQAVHFLAYSNLTANSPDGKVWLKELHAACHPPVGFERFTWAVTNLQERGKISGSDRLALRLDQFTEQQLQQA